MKNLLLIPAMLLLAGCSSAPTKEPMRFPVSPMMATSYSSGVMSIAWKAETNQTYTIYYTDVLPGSRPSWRPLPQANGLRGNGTQITVTDRVQEENQRRYMLLTGDQKPY